MSNILIRDAKREDCKEIRRLIQELADFEKMPNGPVIDDKVLERDGFDLEPPLYYCYVAEDPEDAKRLVGYAIYYYVYGTWTGRKMYLEDIFVTERMKGKGIGNSLFQKVVEKGVEMGCRDMDFVVLDWNPATDFYTARNAVDITEKEKWHLFRLHTVNMHKLVNKK